MLQLSWTQPPNDYPSSDGKPMAENDWHRDQMLEVIETLAHHFRNQPDVYVSGNLLWFYRRNDRRRHVSPDVMVSFGVPKGKRMNYLQWVEGHAPQVVIELTSKTTRSEDLGRKLFIYEDEGVQEYYLFDPRQTYLKPRFRAYHRLGEQLVSVIGETIASPHLGLDLLVESDKLRFRCPRTQRILLTPSERAEAEAERADAEAQRAETEAARADAETQRADAETQRAETEAQRADAEAARARSAEERIRELERSHAELLRRL